MAALVPQLLDARSGLGAAQVDWGRLRPAPPKRASVFGVALLALAIGLMPLGWLLSGGIHETWLPGQGSGPAAMPRVRVVLVDQTSLVRFITGATIESRSAPSGMTSTLVLSWLGGCGDYRTDLLFSRDGEGFVIRERTDSGGCPFLIGYTRAAAIHLWAPVDASTVRLIGQGGSAGLARNSDTMGQD